MSCAARLRCGGYIAALPTLIYEQEIERAYRLYVTDSLRAIAENSSASAAYYSGGQMGHYPNIRFAELFEKKKVETRTPGQVKKHMMDKLRKIGGERR